MTILVDEPVEYPGKGWWAHMTSDTGAAELHEFARRIGLRMEYYQNHPTHPHYDVTYGKQRQALRYGAVQVKGTELVRRCWKQRPELKGETS